MECHNLSLTFIPASGTQFLISYQQGSVYLQAVDDRHCGPTKSLPWSAACSVGQQTDGVFTKQNNEERTAKESTTQTRTTNALFSIRYDIGTEVHSVKFDSNSGRSVSWFANHIFHVWWNITWKLSSPWYHTLGWWRRFDDRQIEVQPISLCH